MTQPEKNELMNYKSFKRLWSSFGSILMQLKYLLDVRYFLDCYSSSNFIDYSESLQAMKELTSARNEKTRDEFWN